MPACDVRTGVAGIPACEARISAEAKMHHISLPRVMRRPHFLDNRRAFMASAAFEFIPCVSDFQLCASRSSREAINCQFSIKFLEKRHTSFFLS